MVIKLKKYNLGEIADFNKSTIKSSDEFTVIEYLDTSSITENVISEVSVLNIADAPSRAQRKVTNNTIIYSTVRPRLKHYGILSSPRANLIVSTGFVTIDVKDTFKDRISAQFLFLLLTQPNITDFIGNIADTAVSAYPSIKPSELSSISFDFPDIAIQKSISRIWFNCDHKIELNRAINQNLEAMAKQLYDYWFVQFDFPNEEGKPYKSSGGEMVWNEKLKREIPKGWHVVDVSEFANIRRGQIITSKDTSKGNIKVVAAGITYSYLNGESNRPKNTITVSGSGANAGFINFWREPIFASDCTTVNCETEIDTLLCLYGLLLFQDTLYNLAIGAAQPHVYPTHVGSIPILVIPQKIKEKISDLFCESNEIIGINLAEINTLTKQRDELLPLLMNGQVSVNSD